MKKLAFIFVSVLLTGCSFSLKTSLIEEPVVVESKPITSFENCYGSQYCVWEAMNDIHTFEGYEKYKNSQYYRDDAKWNAYIESRINYAALTPESCSVLINTELQERCLFGLQFNQNILTGCENVEENQFACYAQEVFSNPSVEICSRYAGAEKDLCLFSVAIRGGGNDACSQIGTVDDEARCKSFVANSLYFCTDKECVDHYFDRNITEYPRLTYCNFDDTKLQQYCEGYIRNWFALSRNNFLYCSTKDCYGLLLDKKLYTNPLLTKDELEIEACDHFQQEKSRLNCKGFVSDTVASVNYDIKACKSFDCFEKFKGDESLTDERICEVFQSEVGDNEIDVFAGSQELSMCLSVIDYNRALVAQDEALCATPECLEALDVANEEVVEDDTESTLSVDQEELLETEVPTDITEDEVEAILEGVDVEGALDSIDLNETVKGLDLNGLKGALKDSEGVGNIDLNEALDGIDLNEAAKDIDINEALDNINIEELLRQLGESTEE